MSNIKHHIYVGKGFQEDTSCRQLWTVKGAFNESCKQVIFLFFVFFKNKKQKTKKQWLIMLIRNYSIIFPFKNDSWVKSPKFYSWTYSSCL